MELKPCPFCGGEVYLCYSSKSDTFWFYHYDENDCPFGWFEMRHDEAVQSLADAMQAWNRRADNG